MHPDVGFRVVRFHQSVTQHQHNSINKTVLSLGTTEKSLPEDPRAGRSTPGVALPALSRGDGSPPLTGWQRFS